MKNIKQFTLEETVFIQFLRKNLHVTILFANKGVFHPLAFLSNIIIHV